MINCFFQPDVAYCYEVVTAWSQTSKLNLHEFLNRRLHNCPALICRQTYSCPVAVSNCTCLLAVVPQSVFLQSISRCLPMCQHTNIYFTALQIMHSLHMCLHMHKLCLYSDCVFQHMRPCCLVRRYQRFIATCCLHLEGRVSRYG
jgi:hypothetical protein